MPFPLAVSMTGMIAHGGFNLFPRLRVGFLGGGTSWIPQVIDRYFRDRPVPAGPGHDAALACG